jgi:RecB family exonuclease
MLSYSALRARAIDFVRGNSPVLVLGPTRVAADEIARNACADSLIGVHRFSFREAVMELATPELLRRGLVPVSRTVREALAARVTAVALDRGELSYLKPVARFPGFPKALTETFEELRLNDVPTHELTDCGASGQDLGHLLDLYLRELSTRRLADHAARAGLAREGLASRPHPINQMALLVWDVSPTTRIERTLLRDLYDAAPSRVELHPNRLEGSVESSLRSLQKYLFSADAVPSREEDPSFAIFSTSGEALEGVEIARQIVAAVDRGIRFDEVAILLRSPARHQALISEALRRAGIRFHSSAGTRRPDPAGRAFLALLLCAAEGLSASRFAEYLSLGQLPESDEPVTPALWERLLVDAAVIGGLSRWELRLDGLREECHRRYRVESDEDAREALARRAASIESLRATALPIVSKLAELPRRARWGEWIGALLNLAEFTIGDAERLAELLEELEPMSDIGPVELQEVLLVLTPRLNSLTTASKESRYGKVWVSGIEEARGMSFRQVFVPGVNEGLFPRPVAEDPLLTRTQREALGIDLRPDDTELLRIAAACASERLVLSFSRLDLLTGRERVPSFYAFAAHRAAGGRELDVREFERRVRSATGTRIGWPAPADAAHAIDDAEFDLAMLAPRAPGSGLYLKQLPGRAVDSLRARWVRWHKPWKAADGLVIEEIGSDALALYRLTQRPWSPSLLQQYARCPYRFVLRGIHRLRPAERPCGIQRLDPATRGEIYHQVQFELMRDLSEQGVLPVTRANLPLALERLDLALKRVARAAEAELAPAIPQIWRSEIQTLRADLRGWLQQNAWREPDWTPEFNELSFGLQDPTGRDPRSRREPVTLDGGFQLQGSIDSIERHRSGLLRVVDHKTGSIPDPRPEMVGGGEVLQPALYALAAEKILKEPVNLGRLSYSTIAQNYTAIDVPLNDWVRRRAMQSLEVIEAAIGDGFLPAAPRKDGCRKCDYLPVCGPYEEERVREKSQVELKGLKELRGWR